MTMRLRNGLTIDLKVLLLTLQKIAAGTAIPKLLKLLFLKSKTILFPLHPMKQQNINRVRLYAKPATRNQSKIKYFGTVALFCISFTLASYYTNSPQLKQCLADSTINNDYCVKKFLG
tara:strand:- start:94 stop:447 length:354 start_codon:yes stop_codon:yes gene_type:complete